MRTHAVVSIALLAGLAGAVACTSPSGDDDVDGSEAAVTTKNMTSNDFGLEKGEVVLTLDDGPGPETAKLAQFLADKDVPAVFFMVGKNAKANPGIVKEVAEISAKKGGSLIIANHSNTHTTPLPKQGTEGALSEIMTADSTLAPSIQASQQGMPSSISFFRPPYGAFTSLGAGSIASINERGADKYVGPVFWDIGGELTEKFSADWACWGKNGKSVNDCAKGYVDETIQRKRGIILVHDVHAKTVDMLMGRNGATSLIDQIRGAGFRFVSLRAHEEAVIKFRAEQNRLAEGSAKIDAVVSNAENGRVVVDVKTTGAAKVLAQFDNLPNATEFTGDKKLDVTLPPGAHFVTVTALGTDGKAISQKRFTFVVAAPLQAGSLEETMPGRPVCVNFNLLKPGMAFRIYQDKRTCDVEFTDAQGKTRKPFSPPFADDCYAIKGVLRANREPKLVGPGEWSAEFDLTYAADPNDKSKLGIVMDADDGSISAGSRFARGTNRPDLSMTVDSVDCEHGEWRGKFHQPNGRFESFLIRAVKSPQTGLKIDFRE